MIKFDVTYEITTPESAEHGLAAEQGFVARPMTLQTAIDAVTSTRSCSAGDIQAIEPNCSGWYDGALFRWITVYHGMDFIEGTYESRSLHIPDTVTPSSKLRIARLLGVQ